jgi:hypothetical protein
LRIANANIEFGVAVATDASYTVKRIDNDFLDDAGGPRIESDTQLLFPSRDACCAVGG